MSVPASIVKAYDVRGLCPEELTEQSARALGAAFAQHCAASRVVVGRDVRTTSEMLFAAFTDGVTAVGVDVVDLGLASTDLLYFASGHLSCPGAMITASHNPAAYNGFKLCGPAAAPIGIESGLAEIAQLASRGTAGYRAGGPPATPGSVQQLDLLAAFVEHVLSFVAPADISGLRVVADTANGMGGLVLPAVFERLDCELDVLYGELDGTFPNHPADPINVENQADLRAAVSERRADVGLAFDGDADRVFVVDEQAHSVSGSELTALVASSVLAREGPGPILHNLICSRAVPEVIAECGGTPVRTKVGHSYIKAEMARTGAAFGGEHSGHYYFARNYRADSGLIATVVLLEQMCASGRSLSELLKPFRRYAHSGEVNLVVDEPRRAIETVAERFAGSSLCKALDRLDGLSVDCGDWWFNVRASNTENLLRLNLEATDASTVDARTAEVVDLVSARSVT